MRGRASVPAPTLPMRTYRIRLYDQARAHIRTSYACVLKRGQAYAQARLILAASPGAALFQVEEI